MIMKNRMETTGVMGVIYGLYGIYWGYIGTMEKKMETMGIIRFISGLYRGYIGIMEDKMQTTIFGCVLLHFGFGGLSYEKGESNGKSTKSHPKPYACYAQVPENLWSRLLFLRWPGQIGRDAPATYECLVGFKV